MYSNGCGDCEQRRNGLGDAYGRSRYRAPAPRVAIARPLRPGERRPAATTTRGLGFDWRTVLIGGLQTGIGVATGNPALVAGGATTAVGGAVQSGGSSTCAGQEDARTVAARLNTIGAAGEGQKAELVRLLAATRPSWFGGTFNELFQKANQLAFAIAGGGDCKVGTDAGRQLVQFYMSFPPMPERYATTMPVLREDDYSFPTTANPERSPPVYDPGETLPGTTAAADPGPSIWDRIKDYAGDAARAAAEAAARAAAATTYRALPDTTRADLEREIMLERYGSGAGLLTSSAMPWLLGGGLVVGALLLSGGGRRR